MRNETVFCVTNSRWHANASSDRVSFRRRCNDSTLQRITTAKRNVSTTPHFHPDFLRRCRPAINHARLPQRRDGRRSGEHQIAVAYRAACSPHTTEGRPATPTCHGELASTRKRSEGGSPAKNPPRYIASPCKSAWIFVYQLGSMIPVIICSAANVASPLRGKVRPRAT